MRTYNFSLFSFPLILSLVVPVTSNAQIPEEIIVTAQKREQSIHDVSTSISAGNTNYFHAIFDISIIE